MNTEHSRDVGPAMLRAVEELQGLVRARYANAAFEVEWGEDNPESVHLIAIVDANDPDNVLDLVIDRVLELQIDSGLPIHVIPVPPIKSVLKEMSRPRSKGRRAVNLEAITPLPRGRIPRKG